jgi:condensin-2 complex subunit D3
LKIVKKNVLENIVPIVIELKNLLEKQHSPLLRNLMEYLKELFKDYKDEIEGTT